MTANGNIVSFGGGEYIPKMIIVMVKQFCEHSLKSVELCTLSCKCYVYGM